MVTNPYFVNIYMYVYILFNVDTHTHIYMKDKGGCVTSPVRINKLFLTKPICERMLQCTLRTKTKRAPMSRQPEPPNVRKHDLIRSDYKLNFTLKLS